MFYSNISAKERYLFGTWQPNKISTVQHFNIGIDLFEKPPFPQVDRADKTDSPLLLLKTIEIDIELQSLILFEI